jgi:hypothetical protein
MDKQRKPPGRNWQPAEAPPPAQESSWTDTIKRGVRDRIQKGLFKGDDTSASGEQRRKFKFTD